MNPIGSANKYIQQAMDEYGVFDYSSIPLEDEEEQFGFLDAIAKAVGEHGPKVAKFFDDNKDFIKNVATGVEQAQGLLGKSKKTTSKGRKNIKRSKRRAVAAKAMNNVDEMLKAKVQNMKGQIQVSLGEMRRQVTMSGIVDADVQLEIIRNAFTKQYMDKKADPNATPLELKVLKKAIYDMDQKLMEAFNRRNQSRVSRGLPPLVRVGQPTLEYIV